MDITHLIAHPEELDQETLYDLRRLVAVYPTYHAARVLFLQNLFILHDTSFDQELRRAALLVPDRRVLFAMTQNLAKRAKVMAAKVEDKTAEVPQTVAQAPAEAAADRPATKNRRPTKKYASRDLTATLLDDFLNTTPTPIAKKRAKVDPSTDYMAYLMQQEGESKDEPVSSSASRLDSLIDSFIASQEEGLVLPENPREPEGIIDEPAAQLPEPKRADPVIEPAPAETPAEAAASAEVPAKAEETVATEDSALAEAPALHPVAPTAPTTKAVKTARQEIQRGKGELSETLAQIYIKQQKYERAIDILNKVSHTEAAKHNPYLTDQMRFLKKLAAIKQSQKPS